MPTTVTNPLSGLIDGMLQGYGLGMQLRREKMQEEAHQRAIASQDREAQVKDIQTQMMLGQNARPVNAGTVEDALPAAPVPSGGPMGDVTKNLFPKMEGGNPQIPIVRPVDKSRRVSYKGRDGQAQEYELYTPEEQMQRQVERATAMKRADSVPIQTPQHLRDIGFPEVMWIPSNQTTHAADTLTQTAPMATPPAYQELGGLPTVPQRMMPSVMSTVNGAANRTAANTRAKDATTSREKIAGDNRTAANARAADANASRERTASGRNSTTLAAAKIRGENALKPKAITPNESAQESERLRTQIRTYDSLIAIPNGEPFKDPDTRNVTEAKTMNSMWRSRYAQLKTDASKRLKDLGAAPAPGGMPQQTQAPKQLTDPAVAKGYLEKAGGDKEKARQLAKVDGWSF